MDQQSNGQLELTLSQLRKATKFLIVVRAFNRYGEGPLSSPTSAITFEDGEDCYIDRYIKKKVFDNCLIVCVKW